MLLYSEQFYRKLRLLSNDLTLVNPLIICSGFCIRGVFFSSSFYRKDLFLENIREINFYWVAILAVLGRTFTIFYTCKLFRVTLRFPCTTKTFNIKSFNNIPIKFALLCLGSGFIGIEQILSNYTGLVEFCEVWVRITLIFIPLIFYRGSMKLFRICGPSLLYIKTLFFSNMSSVLRKPFFHKHHLTDLVFTSSPNFISRLYHINNSDIFTGLIVIFTIFMYIVT